MIDQDQKDKKKILKIAKNREQVREKNEELVDKYRDRVAFFV